MTVGTLKPIGRLSPAEQVLQRLTALLQSGSVKPGDLLPAERLLAAQLGVSRVVIREAAKRLEQQGLVRIRQGIGVEVTNNPSLPVEQSITRLLPRIRQRLQQSAQARLLIEPELAALAALHATPLSLKRLKAVHAKMKDDLDVHTSALYDIEFHDTIAEMAGNKVLALMLSSVASIGRLSREVTIRKFGIEKGRLMHEEILNALAKADAGLARRAMHKHLLTTVEDLS